MLFNSKFLVRLSKLVYGVQCHFQQYYSYIVVVSFIGGGNQSTRRKPSICCLSQYISLMNINIFSTQIIDLKKTKREIYYFANTHALENMNHLFIGCLINNLIASSQSTIYKTTLNCNLQLIYIIIDLYKSKIQSQ